MKDWIVEVVSTQAGSHHDDDEDNDDNDGERGRGVWGVGVTIVFAKDWIVQVVMHELVHVVSDGSMIVMMMVVVVVVVVVERERIGSRGR